MHATIKESSTLGESVTGSSDSRRESTRLAFAIESVDRLISLWEVLYEDRTVYQRYAGDEVVFQSYRAGTIRCLKDEWSYYDTLCRAQSLIPRWLPTNQRLRELDRGLIPDTTVSDLQELRGEIIGLAFELGEPHQVDYSLYGDIDNRDSEASDRYHHLIRTVREKKDAWCKQQALMAELQWAGITEDPFVWNDPFVVSVYETAESEPQQAAVSDDGLFRDQADSAETSSQTRRGRKTIVIDWALAAREYWALKNELENRGEYRRPSIPEVCDRLTCGGRGVSAKTFRKRRDEDGILWPPAELNEDHLAA